MSKINQAFGKVVVKLRRERNQSQEDLAWSIGGSPKYLSDVELGKRNVGLLYVKKISVAFGLSLIEIFDLIEEELKYENTK